MSMQTLILHVDLASYTLKKQKPRVVTFKIDPSDLEELDKAAKLLGLSRSELIRLAIHELLKALPTQG